MGRRSETACKKVCNFFKTSWNGSSSSSLMSDPKFKRQEIKTRAIMDLAITLAHSSVAFNLAKMLKGKLMVNHNWSLMKTNRATTILRMSNRLAFKYIIKSEMDNRLVEATLFILISIITFQVTLNRVLAATCNTIQSLKCISIILRVESTHLTSIRHLCREAPISIPHICSISSMVEIELLAHLRTTLTFT